MRSVSNSMTWHQTWWDQCAIGWSDIFLKDRWSLHSCVKLMRKISSLSDTVDKRDLNYDECNQVLCYEEDKWLYYWNSEVIDCAEDHDVCATGTWETCDISMWVDCEQVTCTYIRMYICAYIHWQWSATAASSSVLLYLFNVTFISSESSDGEKSTIKGRGMWSKIHRVLMVCDLINVCVLIIHTVLTSRYTKTSCDRIDTTWFSSSNYSLIRKCSSCPQEASIVIN